MQLTHQLAQFPNREAGLRRVKRYSLYSTMMYRTDLWIHSRRVAWIVEKITPLAETVFGNAFSTTKAIALALVHDDAEIIFGDVQAGNKAKMSKEELEKIKQQEFDAINVLAARYPARLGDFSYKDLLLEGAAKNSLEGMIVNWADKYDAFCEALHELYAGNTLWATHVVNEFGRIDLPTEHYIKFFQNFTQKYPQSQALFDLYNGASDDKGGSEGDGEAASKEQAHSWFSVPTDLPNTPAGVVAHVAEYFPHTKESLCQAKGYNPYDQWVALTLEKGDEQDIRRLYERVEG